MQPKFKYTYDADRLFDYHEQQTLIEWCRRHCAPNTWRYFGVYCRTPCVLRFQYEEDLLALRLSLGV